MTTNRVANRHPMQGRTTSCVAPMMASVSHNSDLISLAARIRQWIKSFVCQLSDFHRCKAARDEG